MHFPFCLTRIIHQNQVMSWFENVRVPVYTLGETVHLLCITFFLTTTFISTTFCSRCRTLLWVFCSFSALFPLQCGQCMGGACMCVLCLLHKIKERLPWRSSDWLVDWTDDRICIMWLFVTVWYRCQISSLFITSCCNSSLIMFL